MEYIHFNFHKERTIRIYPLPCLHVGVPQSDVKFIKEHLERIQKDPIARWVYMGDGGDCVTKHSKGGIYEQILSPQQQHDLLVSLLAPIRHQGLFGVRGNHGNRVYKETGLSFDKNLCHRLAIPYLGVSALANIIVGRSSYDLYFNHGTDSGERIQPKVSKAEKFKEFINADALFTAHSHICIELPPAVLLQADNIKQIVRTKLRHQYICGTGYDSRTGYAEDKGYGPLLPAYCSVEFDGRIIRGTAQYGQIFRKWQSDGQHVVNGDYGYVDGRLS